MIDNGIELQEKEFRFCISTEVKELRGNGATHETFGMYKRYTFDRLNISIDPNTPESGVQFPAFEECYDSTIRDTANTIYGICRMLRTAYSVEESKIIKDIVKELYTASLEEYKRTELLINE